MAALTERLGYKNTNSTNSAIYHHKLAELYKSLKPMRVRFKPKKVKRKVATKPKNLVPLYSWEKNGETIDNLHMLLGQFEPYRKV